MAADFYESDKALAEYLLFHYGAPDPRFPKSWAGNFPARCVSECLDLSRLPKNARALDLGCAVGRSAFELGRHCDRVVAIDNSAAFIAAAKKLRARGSLAFAAALEGELTERGVARVPSDIDRKRIEFKVGDAMNLPADLGLFDVALMANLIDRVPDPRRSLAQLPRLLKRGGQLIITSPCTWLESYTPREKWLGGFKRGQRSVFTFDALSEMLAPDFNLSARRDIPFLLREHARKFQLGLSDATMWTRKN